MRYWEEYVDTDDWYRKKLLEDVPAEEFQAACLDEDFGGDVNTDDSESDASDADMGSFVDKESSDDTDYTSDTSGDEGSDSVSEDESEDSSAKDARANF